MRFYSSFECGFFFFISYRTFLIQPVFNSFRKSDSLRLVFIWIKHFSLIKKHFACWYWRHFFPLFLVLNLNCLFPKIYHKKCNIILRIFFHFCLFVLCFCLFICLFVLFLFLFLFFFFRLVCLLLFYFFVTNITFRIRLHTKLINATSHCRHHEKSRRGHLFHPFLTFHISNPVIPMFIIFADLRRREKQHFIIYFWLLYALNWY
jgi:hypothetical protein